MSRLFATLLVTFSLFATLALAQPQNPYLSQAMDQIHNMNERAALKTLEQARRWSGNTPRQLAQVNLYEGLAHAGLSQETKAVEAFRAALLLDPDIQLPVQSSPRIRDWWRKAGGKIPGGDEPRVKEPPGEPTPVLIPVPVPSPGLEPPIGGTVVTPPEGSIRWGRWVGGGLLLAGAVVAGVGAVNGARVPGLTQDVKNAPNIPAGLAAQAQAVHTAQQANILFAVGGGLAVTGAVVWVW